MLDLTKPLSETQKKVDVLERTVRLLAAMLKQQDPVKYDTLVGGSLREQIQRQPEYEADFKRVAQLAMIEL